MKVYLPNLLCQLPSTTDYGLTNIIKLRENIVLNTAENYPALKTLLRSYGFQEVYEKSNREGH
jgi:hypothetical protein